MEQERKGDFWYIQYQWALTLLAMAGYWIIETFLDTYLWIGGNLGGNIFPRDPNEIEARILVMSAILLGSLYAWRVRLALKRLNQEILESAEREKALSEKARRGAEKAKSLSYFVMHDVGSSVVLLGMLARRLAKKYINELSPDAKEICSEIFEVSVSTKNIMQLLGELIETNEVAIHSAVINMEDEIFRRLDKEFSPRFREQAIGFLVGGRDPIPPITGDKIYLYRLFRNLVENSLKHGGKELSRVSIGYRSDGQFHVFSVSDDGRGLGVNDSAKVFEMFERGNAAAGTQGWGLGLANVAEIARLHGGKVRVESNSGEGTTFSVYLPKSLQ